MNNSFDDKQNEMLKLLDTVFTTIPFNRMLGLTLDNFNENQVNLSFEMKNELIGNFVHGILHGGVISSVLDMAGGAAAMKSIIDKNLDCSSNDIAKLIGNCSTIDLQINYLRPGKGERFIAKAWLTKAGKKINFARMELYNQDESLIATGNGTYLLS